MSEKKTREEQLKDLGYESMPLADGTTIAVPKDAPKQVIELLHLLASCPQPWITQTIDFHEYHMLAVINREFSANDIIYLSRVIRNE